MATEIGQIAGPLSGAASGQKSTKTPSDGFRENLETLTGSKNILDRLFQAAGQQFGVPADLLKAVAWAESNFNPKAVSGAGALGIMQLMPDTARSLGVTDPFNPAQNIFGAAVYLRSLLDRFQGDVSLALAAYNAGPGAVQKYGGVPPYRETREYIEKVLGFLRRTGADPAAEEMVGTNLGVPPGEGILQAPTADRQNTAELVKLWSEALMVEAALRIE